jgi:DNA-binding transcriptional LysR family regulator
MARARQDWEDRIGRRIKLRDIHILSAVVRWGSMAKAASHLGMSQPAVSEAIASLEHALRVRLLDRNAQGVEPTIYADAFLKRGQVVFDEIRQGIQDIEYLTNPEAGEVRIACPEFLSADLLPRAISRFSRRYPKVVFSVVHPDTMTLDNHELQERMVDITLARVPEAFHDDDLNVEVLFDDPHRVIAGTSSRWAKRHSIALVELADEPWVLPPAPVIYDPVKAEFKARGHKMSNVTMNASSLLLRNQLLATGRFISMMPSSLLAKNARKWSLKALPVDAEFPSPPISMVTLKRRTLSPVVQLFLEYIRASSKTTPAQPE